MEKKMVTIEQSDGSTIEVELVTYLMSDDQQSNYIVYSKSVAYFIKENIKVCRHKNIIFLLNIKIP